MGLFKSKKPTAAHVPDVLCTPVPAPAAPVSTPKKSGSPRYLDKSGSSAKALFTDSTEDILHDFDIDNVAAELDLDLASPSALITAELAKMAVKAELTKARKPIASLGTTALEDVSNEQKRIAQPQSRPGSA